MGRAALRGGRRQCGEAPALGSVLLIDASTPSTSAQLKPIIDAAPCVPSAPRYGSLGGASHSPYVARHRDVLAGRREAHARHPLRGRDEAACDSGGSRRLDRGSHTSALVATHARRLFTRTIMTRLMLCDAWSVREQLALLGGWDSCDWQLRVT